MINIELDNLSKRFNNRWLFNKLSLTIIEGEKVAVIGHNGSGKSTLLHVISGFIKATQGTVNYKLNELNIPQDEWYKFFSFAAPYMDLIEELTADEFLDFYTQHQPFMKGVTKDSFYDSTCLLSSKSQTLRSFSSGMKQRFKLALALLSSSKIVLLDEPLSNLDDNGTFFYKDIITKYAFEKTIIICSNNIKDEIFCCTKEIMLDRK